MQNLTNNNHLVFPSPLHHLTVHKHEQFAGDLVDFSCLEADLTNIQTHVSLSCATGGVAKRIRGDEVSV